MHSQLVLGGGDERVLVPGRPPFYRFKARCLRPGRIQGRRTTIGPDRVSSDEKTVGAEMANEVLEGDLPPPGNREVGTVAGTQDDVERAPQINCGDVALDPLR